MAGDASAQARPPVLAPLRLIYAANGIESKKKLRQRLSASRSHSGAPRGPVSLAEQGNGARFPSSPSAARPRGSNKKNYALDISRLFYRKM